MATQGQDYIDYVKFAAGKRLSVETHVGGSIDSDPRRGMEQADAIYPRTSASSSGRSRTRATASRATRSWIVRRR